MPTVPRALETPATTDEEIFAECAERLRIAIEAESANRASAVEALEFYNGKQWPDDLYNQRKIDRRPSLVINLTKMFVRRIENNMRQQRPRIKVHPVGDGANVAKADVLAGLIRHIENRSSASVAYDTGAESAVRGGWGYWRIRSEYCDDNSFDQELCIDAIRNPFVVYMDPGAVEPDGSDAEWVIITELMPRSEYKRQYPKAQNTEFLQRGNGDDQKNWETKQDIRLAEYYRIQRTTETLYRMTNGMAMWADDMRQLKQELAAANVTIATDQNGDEIKRKSYRQRVEWYRLNGLDIVDRRTIAKDPLPDKWIPVIRCEGNVLDVNGKVTRTGAVHDIMDPARMFNYWRTKETETIALTPLAPFIVAAGQTDGHPEWKDANQKPYSMLTYEPVVIENPDGSKIPLPPPKRQDPVAIPAGFVNAAEGAQRDLMAVAGMPHEPANDMPGSVVSGVALAKRQALSDIGHFQYYDNQTRAIAHTGRILVQLIPFYYSTERMQRIIGEDGVPSMVAINSPQPSMADPAVMEIKNDLTVGRYDVVMDTGPGYETKRLEGADAMLDLLKTPLAEPIAKVGADLVVRNMDFAGSSDLADRLMPLNPQGMQKAMENVPKEAKGVVQAIYQQLTQTQQALQNAQLELKFKSNVELGWMHTELEKARIKAGEAAEHDRTKREDTHVRAVTQHNIAEIGSVTDILVEKLKHGHDEKMADKQIAADTKAESANGAAKD